MVDACQYDRIASRTVRIFETSRSDDASLPQTGSPIERAGASVLRSHQRQRGPRRTTRTEGAAMELRLAGTAHRETDP